MYDVSQLMGKMAVRGTKGMSETISSAYGYYHIDGSRTILNNGPYYGFIIIDENKVYHFNIGYYKYNNISDDAAVLVLFDKDDKVLVSIPWAEGGFLNKYLVFTSEVKKYGVTFNVLPPIKPYPSIANEAYEIQDINDVISSMNTEIEANTASISAVEGNINTQQGNRALYVAAGAVYNEQTGFYELNGLTDITEEQMRVIYMTCCSNVRVGSLNERYSNSQMRTNIRFSDNYGSWIGGFNVQSMCYSCTSLEVFAVSSDANFLYINNCSRMFLNCSKLKTIRGGIKFNSTTQNYTSIFSGCALLETVKCNGIVASISFSDSPLLSLESLQYLITNAVNTSAITVTVHADVYAKIQDETQTEWHALIASAQEKQITFVTA